MRFGNFQRFGNMAGVFQVMAVAIRALDKRDADPPDMAKLTKIATAEMISSKVKTFGLCVFFLLIVTSEYLVAYMYNIWGTGGLHMKNCALETFIRHSHIIHSESQEI